MMPTSLMDILLVLRYVALVSAVVIFGALTFILMRRYYSYVTSPLRHLPGPPRASFWIGHFATILREPFMDPHKRWWQQAQNDMSAAHKKSDDDSATATATATNKLSPPFLQYTTLLGRYTLLVLDPDLIKIILTEPCSVDPVRFAKNYYMLIEIAGRGLATLEGCAWHRHRRLIQPSFHVSFLKQHVNRSAMEHTLTLLQAWRTKATANTIATSNSVMSNTIDSAVDDSSSYCEIEVASHMAAVTLDIIGDVAFAHDFGAHKALTEWANAKTVEINDQAKSDVGDTTTSTSQNAASVNGMIDPLIQALQASFVITGLGVFLSIFNIAWLEKYLNRSVAKTRNLLNDSVDAVLQNAKRRHIASASSSSSEEIATPATASEGTIKTNGAADDASTAKSSKSLLQSLLQASSAESSNSNAPPTTSSTSSSSATVLSDMELRDEIKTFILAGHETTSTWCYWALYALAKHPDVQEKVYAEICKHAPQSVSSPFSSMSMLSSEQVDDMAYVVAFLHEVLRLYSPVGAIVRFTTQRESWHGHDIPSKTRLLIPIHLLHRHVDYWTQPDEFLPERWLDKDECNARHRFCFVPFSAGGRNCIGQRFSEMETKVIVANIVRAFSLELAPCMDDTKLSFTSFLTMRAKQPIVLRVTSRD